MQGNMSYENNNNFENCTPNYSLICFARSCTLYYSSQYSAGIFSSAKALRGPKGCTNICLKKRCTYKMTENDEK